MSHEVPRENQSLDGDFLLHWQMADFRLVICVHLRPSAVSDRIVTA